MGFSSWLVKQSCTALTGDHRWAGVWKPALDWWPQMPCTSTERKAPFPSPCQPCRPHTFFLIFSIFYLGYLEIGRDNVTPPLNDAHSGWWAAGPQPLLALV